MVIPVLTPTEKYNSSYSNSDSSSPALYQVVEHLLLFAIEGVILKHDAVVFNSRESVNVETP